MLVRFVGVLNRDANSQLLGPVPDATRHLVGPVEVHIDENGAV